MSTSLQRTIQQLSEHFAAGIIDAVRAASLDELSGLVNGASRKRGPERPAAAATLGTARPARATPSSRRLERRSPNDLARFVERIINTVRASKKGITAEELKAALHIQRRELPRPLAMALKSKKITNRGKKRATKYFAP